MSIQILEEHGDRAEVHAAIRDGIRAADPHDVGPRDARALYLSVRGDNHAIVGGLYGLTMWRWLMIDGLWVAEGLRGRGLGGRVLAMAEALAFERGCKGSWLGTFGFQARQFYERHGYRVFAELPGFPEGHSHFHLAKHFGASSPGSPDDASRGNEPPALPTNERRR